MLKQQCSHALTKLFFCCKVAPASRRSACCSCTVQDIAAVSKRRVWDHIRTLPQLACCQVATQKQLDLVSHTCCSLPSKRYLQHTVWIKSSSTNYNAMDRPCGALLTLLSPCTDCQRCCKDQHCAKGFRVSTGKLHTVGLL